MKSSRDGCLFVLADDQHLPGAVGVGIIGAVAAGKDDIGRMGPAGCAGQGDLSAGRNNQHGRSALNHPCRERRHMQIGRGVGVFDHHRRDPVDVDGHPKRVRPRRRPDQVVGLVGRVARYLVGKQERPLGIADGFNHLVVHIGRG